MGKRLFLVGLLLAAACKTSARSEDSESSMPVRANSATGTMSRDPTEHALESLGIVGQVLRLDLNSIPRHGKAVEIRKVYPLSKLLVVEGSRKKPRIFAIDRDGLTPRWQTDLLEPSKFPATENPNMVLMVTEHYLHVFEALTGRSAIPFTQSAMRGLRQPPIALPFTPTGSAASQLDTAYLASLGSPGNNKNLESLSLANGRLGWGFRAAGDILTSPKVGGGMEDPKVYFVSSRGQVVCLDATNYASPPAEPRWEMSLEGAVDYDFALTKDTKAGAGALYIVDRAGVVYCVDRITGQRRWTVATGQNPVAGPQVFGDLCTIQMDSGFIAFAKDHMLYRLEVVKGADQGKVFWVRPGKPVTVGRSLSATVQLSDPKITSTEMTLDIERGVLVASASNGRTISVDDLPAEKRVSVFSGNRLHVGDSVIAVEDRGARPVWDNLRVDQIVCRVGSQFVVRIQDSLEVIDAWTGKVVHGAVKIPQTRMFLTNTQDANLYAVGGEAVLYALFPR